MNISALERGLHKGVIHQEDIEDMLDRYKTLLDIAQKSLDLIDGSFENENKDLPKM